MKAKSTIALLSTIGISLVLLALAACGSDPGPENATVEVPSGKSPNASVSGTVTYRERIALSPGAKLVVSLRDVSLQDAAAPLIARQTIDNPGQVPIKFKVEYNRDDIDSRNTYGISARITESDGRLAFTNDTAYDVITRGNPNKVDMLLVLVQPPPDQVEEGTDWRTWVETPAKVAWANLIPNEREKFLRIGYYQSTIENCARPGSQGLEVDGNTIRAKITLMQPPPTAWAIPCDEKLVELDAVEPIGNTLEPGETYRVIVNDVATTSFTLPRSNLVTASSPSRPSRARRSWCWRAPLRSTNSASSPACPRQRLLPVQRLRNPADNVERDRGGHNPPRGRRPDDHLHRRFPHRGNRSPPRLRLRIGREVHRPRQLRQSHVIRSPVGREAFPICGNATVQAS